MIGSAPMAQDGYTSDPILFELLYFSMTRLPLCVLLYCGLIAITSVGYAQDAQELARINRELVALQQELNQYEGEYAESQEQVRQEELKVAAIRREIISTQQSISASEVVIRSLQARWMSSISQNCNSKQVFDQRLPPRTATVPKSLSRCYSIKLIPVNLVA